MTILSASFKTAFDSPLAAAAADATRHPEFDLIAALVRDPPRVAFLERYEATSDVYWRKGGLVSFTCSFRIDTSANALDELRDRLARQQALREELDRAIARTVDAIAAASADAA